MPDNLEALRERAKAIRKDIVRMTTEAGSGHPSSSLSATDMVTALYFGDDPNIDSDTVFGVSKSLVVEAKDDPASPVPGLRAVHYDFRLAKAAPGESGRVGADPTKLMKAAE